MSENARRKGTPESHLIEQQLSRAPSRAWAGQVTITTDERAITVPGTWHLELPNEARPLSGHPREALPLPLPSDLAAWQDHLMRVLTLQVAGMQLRVREAGGRHWRSLEFAVPTAPSSIVQVDRAGWQALLGACAGLTLTVDTRPRGGD